MLTTSILPIAPLTIMKANVESLNPKGCVIAARLAEYLPNKKTLLIEAGPSDFMDDRVLDLKQWLNLLGGELDYDYGTTEQPNGTVIIFPPLSQAARGIPKETRPFFNPRSALT